MVDNDWVTDTWTWISSMSPKLANSAATGAHGSGHKDDSISQASGALVLMVLIILTLATIYMAWRVYYKKKYLSVYWTKEFGQSNRMSMLSSPEKDQSSFNDSASQPVKRKPTGKEQAANLEMIATKK